MLGRFRVAPCFEGYLGFYRVIQGLCKVMLLAIRIHCVSDAKINEKIKLSKRQPDSGPSTCWGNCAQGKMRLYPTHSTLNHALPRKHTTNALDSILELKYRRRTIDTLIISNTNNPKPSTNNPKLAQFRGSFCLVAFHALHQFEPPLEPYTCFKAVVALQARRVFRAVF